MAHSHDCYLYSGPISPVNCNDQTAFEYSGHLRDVSILDTSIAQLTSNPSPLNQ